MHRRTDSLQRRSYRHLLHEGYYDVVAHPLNVDRYDVGGLCTHCKTAYNGRYADAPRPAPRRQPRPCRRTSAPPVHPIQGPSAVLRMSMFTGSSVIRGTVILPATPHTLETSPWGDVPCEVEVNPTIPWAVYKACSPVLSGLGVGVGIRRKDPQR